MKEDFQSTKGKLLVISGPSGAGKGTICSRIINDVKDHRLEFSVSMTTRKPRKGEVEGAHYYFVSKETFIETIENDGLLEYAQVYDNYYGTPKKALIDKMEQGIDIVLDIDIQGALNVKKAYPEAVLIFVLPPSMAELRKRLINRNTDDMETIEKRLSKTAQELDFISQYDYLIINDDIDTSVKKVISIVDALHQKVDDSVQQVIDKFKEEA
ncbi:MAG: guanylate kinase [Clostridia bacterium]|nr:guanylate kinase [Clostridia bacterium]